MALNKKRTSQFPGFYKLSIEERHQKLLNETPISKQDVATYLPSGGLPAEQANMMVENALGTLNMPLGLCVNLRVNGKDWIVPMAIEEPSVIAGASHASKLLREGDGIRTTVSPAHMVGQIQVLDIPDMDKASSAVLNSKNDLLALANRPHKRLTAAGGGAFDIETRRLESLGEGDPLGDMLIVHLKVDVKDAMGANAINTMCENLAPHIEKLTGGRVRLRILSNLSDQRTVTVEGRVPVASLKDKRGSDPQDVAKGIVEASVFAERDPYRATTHNKGVMNGIDAMLIAFGQDWRAVEAGAHAYAARNGRYTALATWRVEDGDLVGRMTIPMAVGTVGGVIGVHPTVKTNRQLAQVQNAADLASLAAAIGLVENLGSLRALATEGIQEGHMRLHARNIASEAGAKGDEIDEIAGRMADMGKITREYAIEALAKLRQQAA